MSRSCIHLDAWTFGLSCTHSTFRKLLCCTPQVVAGLSLNRWQPMQFRKGDPKRDHSMTAARIPGCLSDFKQPPILPRRSKYPVFKVPSIVFGTKGLKYWVLGPSGLGCASHLLRFLRGSCSSPEGNSRHCQSPLCPRMREGGAALLTSELAQRANLPQSRPPIWA